MKSAALLTAAALLSLPSFAQVNPPIPTPNSRPIGPGPGDKNRGLSGSKKKKDKGTPKAEQPTIEFSGVTLRNTGSEIEVHTDDGRWLTMKIDKETQWTKDGAPADTALFAPGSTVKAQAAVDDEQFLSALSLDLQKPAPAQTAAVPASASPANSSQDDDTQLTQSKKPLDVPDAPGRPKLSHAHSASSGIQHVDSESGAASSIPISTAKRSRDNDQQDFTIGSDTPLRKASKGGVGSDVLNRATDWAEGFDRGLPNYVCREVITRYAQQGKGADWEPQDVVTANLVYQDGKEDYRDITVGNKKVSDMTKTGGQWTTGQFATMLHSLFQPTRDTDFTYHRTTNIHDIEAAEFDYSVALPNSDWSILVGSQILRPRYTGTLWVERNTGVVRRLEQAAKTIPKDFPLDVVETDIDYEEVSLGTKKFLLPVRSESISCWRATSYCSKNVIEFRDYHKFSGESTIEFK